MEQIKLDATKTHDAIKLMEVLIDRSTMTGAEFKVFDKALETLRNEISKKKKEN